jgi:hypothetical protein
VDALAVNVGCRKRKMPFDRLDDLAGDLNGLQALAVQFTHDLVNARPIIEKQLLREHGLGEDLKAVIGIGLGLGERWKRGGGRGSERR